MSTSPTAPSNTGKQSDLLLWVAGGAVAAVGGAWLVLTQPWASGPQRVALPAPTESATPVTIAMAPLAAEPPDDSGVVGDALDDPLRMARLAFDAGMLVEPEEYSAWTLYARVYEAQPDNAEARAGLTTVADELVRRGETALEQGRFADALAAAQRVLAALPDHPGAQSLDDRAKPVAAKLELAPVAFRPEVQLPAALPPIAPIRPEPAAPARPAPRQTIDPIAKAHEAFEQAMSASRLLTPADQSAKHFLALLTSADPDHALTVAAGERFSKELLSRAAQSLEALDSDAADTWIDEAELVGVDRTGVTSARAALANQLIAMEAAKPLPASALKITSYVAPEYPQRALERGIEGWVDVEFTVAPDGATHAIRVADASNDNYFGREAMAAVEQWRFEPRIFMGRPIEQRSYTRIRFVQ